MATNQAIVKVTSSVFNALDKNKKCNTIYLDLEKAFDTVDHKILIYYLGKVGIRFSALLWFKLYLNNRKQQVNINGAMSDEEIVSYGVPQDTTISPILFNIQMSNVFLIPLKSEIVCYAYDTVLICYNEN
ncbi:Reverse transcriptase domain [Cinara cedri]|uniref:Reverse transcriptase domain n=1 Tax=Cinara cedri TaxID=506608 RepID=A0A5E4NGV6_9HEMI|nr:Reverse transcriptase domain [Cinara cedri]